MPKRLQLQSVCPGRKLVVNRGNCCARNGAGRGLVGSHPSPGRARGEPGSRCEVPGEDTPGSRLCVSFQKATGFPTLPTSARSLRRRQHKSQGCPCHRCPFPRRVVRVVPRCGQGWASPASPAAGPTACGSQPCWQSIASAMKPLMKFQPKRLLIVYFL